MGFRISFFQYLLSGLMVVPGSVVGGMERIVPNVVDILFITVRYRAWLVWSVWVVVVLSRFRSVILLDGCKKKNISSLSSF